MYNLIVIFVHRPFHRSSVTLARERCEQAALAVMPLLQVGAYPYLEYSQLITHSFLRIITGCDTGTTIWVGLCLYQSQNKTD